MVLLERHATAIAVLLILLASIRIVLTYNVFSHTSDEPFHIICGIEWLQDGAYTFETQHPPLARVATAIGPYLLGARITNHPKPDSLEVLVQGMLLLSRDHQYDLTLALARLGILPFFWIACLVLFFWAKRYYGATVSVVALFFFSFAPPILAHAGLATTDMPLTAFMGASFFAAMVWIEEPTFLRAGILGFCFGLAAISKFSSLPFFAACLGCTLLFFGAIERPGLPSLLAGAKRALPSLGVATMSTALVIWAGFRFSFGKIPPFSFPIPAPELVSGIQSVMRHNQMGNHSYLLGRFSPIGFWYYYPVVLAVKTPLALLVLFGLGLFFAFRRSGRPAQVWQPLGFIAGILAVGLYSRINIGVRHILPIYFGVCLLAAIAAVRLPEFLRGHWLTIGAAGLMVWLAGSSLLAHPDYLPYFNALAGSEPEKVLVDSDLDWGQDLKRLAHRLQEVGADRLTFYPTAMSDLSVFGFPPVLTEDPFKPAVGWNAVALTDWKLTRMGLAGSEDAQTINKFPDRPLWPDQTVRGELVGRTILLWNISAKGDVLFPITNGNR